MWQWFGWRPASPAGAEHEGHRRGGAGVGDFPERTSHIHKTPLISQFPTHTHKPACRLLGYKLGFFILQLTETYSMWCMCICASPCLQIVLPCKYFIIWWGATDPYGQDLLSRLDFISGAWVWQLIRNKNPVIMLFFSFCRREKKIILKNVLAVLLGPKTTSDPVNFHRQKKAHFSKYPHPQKRQPRLIGNTYLYLHFCKYIPTVNFRFQLKWQQHLFLSTQDNGGRLLINKHLFFLCGYLQNTKLWPQRSFIITHDLNAFLH